MKDMTYSEGSAWSRGLVDEIVPAAPYTAGRVRVTAGRRGPVLDEVCALLGCDRGDLLERVRTLLTDLALARAAGPGKRGDLPAGATEVLVPYCTPEELAEEYLEHEAPDTRCEYERARRLARAVEEAMPALVTAIDRVEYVDGHYKPFVSDAQAALARLDALTGWLRGVPWARPSRPG